VAQKRRRQVRRTYHPRKTSPTVARLRTLRCPPATQSGPVFRNAEFPESTATLEREMMLRGLIDFWVT